MLKHHLRTTLDRRMRVLVTGSSGHLGEALVRRLMELGREVGGLDVLPSPFTTSVGSIVDRATVDRCMIGVEAVIHTATLHKPHVGTHRRQEFVDTNITGTLNLLEAAVTAGVKSFVFTSTTSTFGDALVPPPGAPAAWITEDVRPVPKNIYGVTKVAAEDLCQLFYRNHGLPCLVLRTSRFFPEADDNPIARDAFADENLKVNEFLYRRVDIEDVVSAHLLSVDRAPTIGFDRYIISATTLFMREDLADLRMNAPSVIARHLPEYVAEYERRGWKMAPSIDRVYVNAKARRELGWKPKYDFPYLIACLKNSEETRSTLARQVGSKGYHAKPFTPTHTPSNNPWH